MSNAQSSRREELLQSYYV